MDTSRTGGTYLGNELAINKTLTIGAASQEISVPKNRTAYSIRNCSVGGQIVSITLSNTDIAVDNVGIVLTAGQSLVESDSENYECWSGSIRAISSAAGAVLAIMERV